MKRMLGWITLGGMILAGAGCATLDTIERAQESLNQAKAAGAEESAPYAYHAADAYLTYAIVEKDEMDWPAAERFAEKSILYSEQALQQAKGGAQ